MKPLIYQYRMQWRELLQCVGIHCGKRNGIQLSYGTGAGKECVAAVYVGTAAVCSIKTDFVDRTEWDSHLLQWRS